MWVDGEIYDVSEVLEFEKNKKYDIVIVIDCIVVKEGICFCLFDLFEVVLCLVEGYVIVDVIG